jgi:hypothetical protein
MVYFKNSICFNDLHSGYSIISVYFQNPLINERACTEKCKEALMPYEPFYLDRLPDYQTIRV